MNSFPSNLREQLEAHDQLHVLRFWEELNEDQQTQFIKQLSSVNLEEFGNFQTQFRNNPSGGHQAPSPVQVLKRSDHIALQELGEAIIRNGELGVLTVAGGQGSRLGWSGPKGTYPATPITGKSLFQLIAEKIVYASNKYCVKIPWYIMTSLENDETTRSFLLDNNCFGMDRTDIFGFTQRHVPVLNEEGNLLLDSKHSIAMNPDGHGGVISALQNSGVFDEMAGRRIKYLSYVQVDNPLARVVDPVFLGMHVDQGSSLEASSKCVLKTDPEERVGVFCEVDGNTQVVEYCDLSEEQSASKNDDGSLVLNAGSIALHIFSTDFLNRVANELPWHVAHKKVSYVNEDGEQVEPETPNAYKFEKFVFDVLPFSERPIVLQTTREEEFAPIKNKDGNDSPASSHALQLELAADWLRLREIDVPTSAKVELSPLAGASPDDLDATELPQTIQPDEIVVI